MAPTKKKTIKEKEISSRYTEATGRRKTAVSRVRIFDEGSGIIVNNKDYHDYFPHDRLCRIVQSVLREADRENKGKITVLVTGGGAHAQAEATRHGIARALVEQNPELRKKLRVAGFLTRDPRMKERRKFGLKKARRAPQWSKR
jgi:small subunit ribosomal protein S9